MPISPELSERIDRAVQQALAGRDTLENLIGKLLHGREPHWSDPVWSRSDMDVFYEAAYRWKAIRDAQTPPQAEKQGARGLIRDLTGHRHGRLLVIELAAKKGGHSYWRCVCDCGRECVVKSPNLLRAAGTRSCGCYAAEMRPTPTKRRRRKAIDATEK